MEISEIFALDNKIQRVEGKNLLGKRGKGRIGSEKGIAEMGMGYGVVCVLFVGFFLEVFLRIDGFEKLMNLIKFCARSRSVSRIAPKWSTQKKKRKNKIEVKRVGTRCNPPSPSFPSPPL